MKIGSSIGTCWWEIRLKEPVITCKLLIVTADFFQNHVDWSYQGRVEVWCFLLLNWNTSTSDVKNTWFFFHFFKIYYSGCKISDWTRMILRTKILFSLNLKLADIEFLSSTKFSIDYYTWVFFGMKDCFWKRSTGFSNENPKTAPLVFRQLGPGKMTRRRHEHIIFRGYWNNEALGHFAIWNTIYGPVKALKNLVFYWSRAEKLIKNQFSKNLNVLSSSNFEVEIRS